MEAILSRQMHGRYMLTRYPPLFGVPTGMHRAVFYPQFCDPVSYHYMCPESTKILCGGKELQHGQYVRVEVNIKWLSDPVKASISEAENPI